MVTINLKETNVSDKNLGTKNISSECTCIKCGICFTCIIFAPAVGISLTASLLPVLWDVQSPS